MSKQQRSSSWSLPSLEDVSTGLGSVVDGVGDLIEQGGEALWGLGESFLGIGGEEEAAPTPTLDAVEEQQEPAVEKSYYTQTVEAYEAGDLDTAAFTYSQMTTGGQAKLQANRPEILSALASHDPELAADIEASKNADIDQQLNNTLCDTLSYAEFMADEAWKAFLDDRGPGWLATAKEGTKVTFPLAEYVEERGDITVDGALKGSGAVDFQMVDGPMANPNSEIEVQVVMALNTYYTAKLDGRTKSLTQTLSKKFIASTVDGEMDMISSEPGYDWKDNRG